MLMDRYVVGAVETPGACVLPDRPSRALMGGCMVSGDRNNDLPSALMVPACDVSAGERVNTALGSRPPLPEKEAADLRAGVTGDECEDDAEDDSTSGARSGDTRCCCCCCAVAWLLLLSEPVPP
jgi:hypothetical protein